MDELQGVATSVNKHVHKSVLLEAIFKATKSSNLPAKQKHERIIIAQTLQTHTSSHVLEELFKRPMGGKDVVMWKTMIVIHKLMREGHSVCIDDLYNRKEFLKSLQGQCATGGTQWSALDASYISYLLDKLNFHKEHSVVPGDCQVSRFKDNIKRFDPNKAVLLAQSLIDLQKSLLTFQERVLTSQGLDACRLAALVPTIQDSYNMYTLTEYLIRKVQNTTDLDVTPIAELFLKTFPVLQGFYFKCSAIPYLKQQLPAMPLLEKPPVFKKADPGAPKKEPKDNDQKKKSKKPEPAVGPSHLTDPFYQMGLNNPNPFSINDPFKNPGIGAYNPLAVNPLQIGGLGVNPLGPNPNTFQNPFNVAPATFQPVNPYNQPMPQPVSFQPPPQPKDPFADLFPLGKKNFGDSDLSGFPGSRVNYPKPGESRDELLAKIRELENRIKELEIEIRDIDGQNSELRTLVSERENGLNAVRVQMEERTKFQQKQFIEANTQLKAHLDNMMKKYEKEKLALVTEQIEASRKLLEQSIFKYENPNNLGNRGATAEEILRCTSTLQSNFDSLIKTLETGGDYTGCTRNLAEKTAKLLDDAKGALSKITDPNAKLQIGSGSRNVAREIQQMLQHTISIASQTGGKADARQMEFLKGEQARFTAQLSAVNSAINASSHLLRRDAQAANLEAMAEQELHNSVRQLGDIQKTIQSQNAARPATQGINIGLTIGKAGEAIVFATGHLVNAAAAAQQERVKREASGLVDDNFHRDPIFTEALVNSAKGIVTGAKQLSVACGNCTQTKVDANALKEASRFISKETVQMVTASRAKNNGQSQANIDAAAEAVTRATHDLVEAANSFSNAEEMEILAKSDTTADNIRAEIDQQTEINRLQKELDQARTVLLQMTKTRGANPNAVSSFLPNAPTPVPQTSTSNNPFLSNNINFN